LLGPREIQGIIAESPGRIGRAASGVADIRLALRPEAGEWSPLEILAHLRACADAWGDVRIVRMLSEDEPRMRAINPKRWIRDTDYDEIAFSESLEAFTRQRRKLLELFEWISRVDWERGATMTGGTRCRQRQTLLRGTNGRTSSKSRSVANF
jgi:hypothetical protein